MDAQSIMNIDQVDAGSYGCSEHDEHRSDGCWLPWISHYVCSNRICWHADKMMIVISVYCPQYVSLHNSVMTPCRPPSYGRPHATKFVKIIRNYAYGRYKLCSTGCDLFQPFTRHSPFAWWNPDENHTSFDVICMFPSTISYSYTSDVIQPIHSHCLLNIQVIRHIH